MEFIRQYIGEVITLLIGGGATWLWQRVKTRRERKSDDFTFLNDALAKMQESIKSLTMQNGELINTVSELQDKILRYVNENVNLRGDVERLTREVGQLRRELAKFNKKNENENK